MSSSTEKVGTSSDMKKDFEDSTSDIAHEDGVTAAYEAKSRLVNEHMQKEVGFGRYQFQLFLLTGLGWAADNIWLQGVAIILPQIQRELQPARVEFATLALYVGLILGATTWGILADLIGRRLSFNITLFIAGVFGVAAGGANNFTTLAALIACMGFGVGGNLPVDGALFLEHIPKSHQWLLTLLSAWWALGQLFASLIAWPLIGNFSCDPNVAECLKADNMGWRYTFYTLGGVTFVMWILRFVVFDLQESSKFMIAKGRDEEAVRILEHIARKNGRTITLTVEALRNVSNDASSDGKDHLTTFDLIKQSFSNFSLSHITPLFSTRRLAVNTTITILLWGLIGLAYPLFNGFITLYLTTQVPNSDTNAMYGVLYAYTPEVFPAPHRGTGDALCSAFNRITGILAPVIKIATTNRDGSASTSIANGNGRKSCFMISVGNNFRALHRGLAQLGPFMPSSHVLNAESKFRAQLELSDSEFNVNVHHLRALASHGSYIPGS
ncbi:hypothetical protein ONZ45_g15837 [Pleurotus djamor]|nr:hypothetical protein ONZ45_g15837 [Pleurotus djamor]